MSDADNLRGCLRFVSYEIANTGISIVEMLSCI